MGRVGLYAGVLVMAALCAGAARVGLPVMSSRSNVGDPSLAHMGLAISEDGSIWVVNADGSGRRRLPNLDKSASYDPTWSPDGTQIAFTLYRWRSGRSDIYVMKSDGGGVRRVTGNGFRPSWSPDGKRIAFDHSLCDRCAVTAYVVNVDGSEPHSLTPLGVDPVWSPDGKTVAVAGSRIWLVNAAGGSTRGITTPASLDAESPSWSPDGKQIVVDGPAGEGVWVVNADGSGLRRLTRPKGDMDDTDPMWSPDGEWIGFLRGGACWAGNPENPNIYVVHPNGSGLHRLPLDRGCVLAFAWQPVH
jgi:Tol biopolymer transport system component